jgi:hypothetical protein
MSSFVACMMSARAGGISEARADCGCELCAWIRWLQTLPPRTEDDTSRIGVSACQAFECEFASSPDEVSRRKRAFVQANDEILKARAAERERETAGRRCGVWAVAMPLPRWSLTCLCAAWRHKWDAHVILCCHRLEFEAERGLLSTFAGLDDEQKAADARERIRLRDENKRLVSPALLCLVPALHSALNTVHASIVTADDGEAIPGACGS